MRISTNLDIFKCAYFNKEVNSYRLKRKIYAKLLDWKNDSDANKDILLEGARRIGKSTIVEEFAKNEYTSYIVVDFTKKNLEVEQYFINYLNDLDTFFMMLSTYYGVKL